MTRRDLPAASDLYRVMVGFGDAPAPGFGEFFDRTLLRSPLADPKIPSLVFDDPSDGVVGLLGVHPRRFRFGDEPLRAAVPGPLIVRPDHRPRGIGALLMRSFLGGAQDFSFNDRAVDEVRDIWERLGGAIDIAGSLTWYRPLAPVGAAVSATTRSLLERDEAPGGRVWAGVDSVLGRRLRPPAPGAGRAEPLTADGLVELVGRLRRQFPLRPDYDAETYEALFAAMETVDLRERLERRLIRAEDGRPMGAFTTFVAPYGTARVMQVAAAGRDVGPVLDHLFHEVAAAGAVRVSGRLEPHLAAHLRERRCRLRWHYWSMVHSSRPELVSAVLGGRGLLTRLDGEWWMRPRPEATPPGAPGASDAARPA